MAGSGRPWGAPGSCDRSLRPTEELAPGFHALLCSKPHPLKSVPASTGRFAKEIHRV